MRVNRNQLNYQTGSFKEYLITNGRGSYSSGAINGNLSRQYHGILVNAFTPPVNRFMMAHKVEEQFNSIDIYTRKQWIAGKEKRIEGWKHLIEYSQNPFPKWQYLVGKNIFEKEIFMPYGKDMTIFSYEPILGSGKLDIKVFFNFRDMHDYSQAKDHNYIVEKEAGCIKIIQNGNAIYIYTTLIIDEADVSIEKIENFEGEVVYERTQENLVYEIEINERGALKSDSSRHVLNLNTYLNSKHYIVFSMEKLEDFTIEYIEKLREDQNNRLNSLKTQFSSSFSQDLAIAADQFIVQRESTSSHSVIAGYPWFSDWARDAMISLSGLALTTKRFDVAKSIFTTFIHYLSEGMFPNKFPDIEGEKLEYNTIDAAMWYFVALKNYVDISKDWEYLEKSLLPAALEIYRQYKIGTRFGIKMNEDGLISGGSKESQLTWMDVRYKDWAVTPRYGKAVEINALWYNALCILLEYKYLIDVKEVTEIEMIKNLVESNYESTFYCNEKKMLFDYIAESKNLDIRPNQIFAVSLDYSPLSKKVQKDVVDIVWKTLYTPVGLRSLSSDNIQYKGRYFGNVFNRDSVYHQGTVWTWPLGAFIDAHFKVYKDKKQLELMLKGIKDHFYNEGVIGSIAEIYDGDAPFECRGCFAQAWSVAEILRVIEKYQLDV